MLQIFIRVRKHKDTSFRTNRYLAKPELSAILSHCASNDHPPISANFSVIDKRNRPGIEVLESSYINKTKPHVNNHQAVEKLQIVAYVTYSIARIFLREIIYSFSFTVVSFY